MTYIPNGAPGGGAPTDSSYVVRTAEGSLSNETVLGLLTTGLLKVTTTTGVLSTAVPGVDYPVVDPLLLMGG